MPALNIEPTKRPAQQMGETNAHIGTDVGQQRRGRDEERADHKAGENESHDGCSGGGAREAVDDEDGSERAEEGRELDAAESPDRDLDWKNVDQGHAKLSTSGSADDVRIGQGV